MTETQASSYPARLEPASQNWRWKCLHFILTGRQENFNSEGDDATSTHSQFCCVGHDKTDLLKHLDEGRQRELACWNKEHQHRAQESADDSTVDVIMEGPDLPDDDPVDGTQPNKDATAAQVFVAEWKKWLQQLQRASTAQEASRKSAGIRPEVAKVATVESKTEDDCDEDDLLLHLDVERRKELNRISQRRSRANAKIDCEKNRTDSFDNELSAEERVECMRLLRRALGPEGLVECVYVVCDRLVLRAASRRVNDNDKEYLKLMKKNLTVDTAKLPTALLDLYRAPACLSTLDSVLVSPHEIKMYKDEDVNQRAWISICEACDRLIRRGELPKFAIAMDFCGVTSAAPERLDNP
ncbi:hypothetical protein PC129_g19399 [Phytophthora cactorum]|uniref:Uncharacterized protein n=2 Tax=Phytophthora cactorum TaxID=29920 RepID=A0A8T0Z7J7_9STRA|nr:hypothetical protein PC113_g9818 [Phytophthora cactorum]KAG3020814.1 hypothetical protein PC119_g9840 [Phytophthora cactorum]KAG3170343.1 hypothetical protein C6341_g10824 [Phytophthora cactorum]KAG3209588.1 hypothetical protein PC129_g19399 [Phytophthora cactorum]